MRSRDQAMISSPSGVWPAAGTTHAMPTSPIRSSGTPITATWPIAGWVEQHVLDLGRIHVEAADDDHVLQAADDPHVAALVHRGEVAGVQEAALVDRRRRRFGIVEIVLHHAVAAHEQLAGRAPLELVRRPRRWRAVGSAMITSRAGHRPAGGGGDRRGVVVGSRAR